MHVLILLLIVEIITEYGVMPLVLLYKIIRVVKFAWKGESTRVKKGGQYTCEYNVVVKTFFLLPWFLVVDVDEICLLRSVLAQTRVLTY